MSKWTHAYIGRNTDCGCIWAATVDDGEASNAAIGAMIRDGLRVERVPLNGGSITVGGCSCGKPESP